MLSWIFKRHSKAKARSWILVVFLSRCFYLFRRDTTSLNWKNIIFYWFFTTSTRMFFLASCLSSEKHRLKSMLELGSILLKTFPNTSFRKVSAPLGPSLFFFKLKVPVVVILVFVSECYTDYNQSRFISIQSRYWGKTKLTWKHDSVERKGREGNRQENQYGLRWKDFQLIGKILHKVENSLNYRLGV